MAFMFDLDDFLHYFDKVRQRTRRLAECIPADRLEWAYKPDAFTPGDLVRHIGVTERYIWAETAHQRQSRYVTHGRELADGRDAVLAFLDRMHSESMELFRALTPEALQSKCATPDRARITTWKWLRMMPEHEIHHRGQIYTLLGLLDVPAPPLFGLTSAQVQAKSRA
jgi:uncharacterized damage-inducible protein DinB